MKKTVRILSALLALLLTCTLFVACKSGGDETPTGDSTTAGGTSAPTGNTGGSGTGGSESGGGTSENTEAEMYRPEKLNFGKGDSPYEFKIGVPAKNVADLFSPVDYVFAQDNLEGDAVNTALADRSDFLEEYYNIAIEPVNSITATVIATQVRAGTDFADVVMTGARQAIQKCARNGQFLDLTTLDTLNLDASYWDQRIQTEYSLGGRVFAIDGDISCYDELTTMVVMYNATLYDRYGYKSKYGSPYTLVSEGKWTFDTMLEMYQGTSSQTGSALTASDTWGMITEITAPYQLFLGSGYKTVKNSSSGLSSMFDEDYEATVNVMLDITERFVTDKETLFAEASGGVLGSDFWREVSDMFANNQALFRSGSLGDATDLRDMESTFGLLPIPRYYEGDGQDGYYCYVSATSGTPWFMPITVKTNYHLETTGTIFEAMAYFSRYMDDAQSLYDAFFDNMTYVKLCRNEEDREMLTLIFNSKTYDIDHACVFSGIGNLIIGAAQGHSVSGLYSNILSVKTATDSEMAAFITDLEKAISAQ